MCRGQPVLPSLQLHNLVDLWFRTASTSKKIPASVGSSAKDFVMVLSYCRKALPPWESSLFYLFYIHNQLFWQQSHRYYCLEICSFSTMRGIYMILFCSWLNMYSQLFSIFLLLLHLLLFFGSWYTCHFLLIKMSGYKSGKKKLNFVHTVTFLWYSVSFFKLIFSSFMFF